MSTQAERLRPQLLLPLSLLFVAILLTVTGELMLKHGMNQHGVLEVELGTVLTTFFRVFSNPFIFFGFVFIFSGSLFWLAVISRVPLSFAYPMLSSSYVLVVFASWLFLGERLTVERIAGVFIIIVGVSLVFRSGQ